MENRRPYTTDGTLPTTYMQTTLQHTHSSTQSQVAPPSHGIIMDTPQDAFFFCTPFSYVKDIHLSSSGKMPEPQLGRTRNRVPGGLQQMHSCISLDGNCSKSARTAEWNRVTARRNIPRNYRRRQILEKDLMG